MQRWVERARSRFGNQMQTKQLSKASHLDIVHGFLQKQEADRAMDALMHELDGQFQSELQLYCGDEPLGKQQREMFWCSRGSIEYSYAGLKMQPRPIPPYLEQLCNEIDCLTGIGFNHVVCNRYRGSKHSISPHADAEAQLGLNPPVVALSLGTTRTFRLVQQNAKKPRRLHVPLTHGSLLVMRGRLQHDWLHSIPKERVNEDDEFNGVRINITMRYVRGQPGWTPQDDMQMAEQEGLIDASSRSMVKSLMRSAGLTLEEAIEVVKRKQKPARSDLALRDA